MILFLKIIFITACIFSFLYRIIALIRSKMTLSKSIMPPRNQNNTYIILPCKGLDPEMKEWLPKIADMKKEIPSLQFLFVFSDSNDSALTTLNAFEDELTYLISKEGPQFNSLKCQNLVSALTYLREKQAHDDDFLIFLDSDAKLSSTWLKNCTDELHQNSNAILTTYRYYKSGSYLASTFSDELLIGQFYPKTRFIWGGLMAGKYQTFKSLEAEKTWQMAFSDDCTLTKQAQTKKIPIYFSHSLLRASTIAHAHASAFVHRQLQIIALYRPNAFKLFLFIKTMISLFGIISFFMSLKFFLIYMAMTSIFALLQTLLTPLKLDLEMIFKIFLAPLTYLWITFLAWRAYCSPQKITWRDVQYELNKNGEVLNRHIALTHEHRR